MEAFAGVLDLGLTDSEGNNALLLACKYGWWSKDPSECLVTAMLEKITVSFKPP